MPSPVFLNTDLQEDTRSRDSYSPLSTIPGASEPQLGTIHFLCSDNVVLRANSIILKLASPVLSEKLPNSSLCIAYPIDVQEQSDAIRILLDMIYPCHVFPEDVPDFRVLRDLAIAAERYRIPLVIDNAKAFILKANPVESFALSCRLGWDNEIVRASTGTLEHDIFSPECEEMLKDVNGIYLSKLYCLHQQRKRKILDSLSAEFDFDAVSEDSHNEGRPKILLRLLLEDHLKAQHTSFPMCDILARFNFGIEEIRYDIIVWMKSVQEALEKAPSGGFLRTPHGLGEILGKNIAIFSTHCPSCRCQLFNENTFVKAISDFLDSGCFPDAIELTSKL